MPSILESALLSQETYLDSSESSNIRGWSDESSNIPHPPLLNASFYAQLWYQKSNNEAVIAIRGTDDLDNILVDIESWYPDVVFNEHDDNLPQRYFRLANVYYHNCLDYLRANFPDAKLSLTGHSLGGALAQLIVVFNQLSHSVIVFNSPGIGYMVPKAESVSSSIHNINSRYGYINKVGKVIGSIDYVDVPEKEIEAKNYFQSKDNEQLEKKLLTTKSSQLDFNSEQLNARISRDEKIEDISLALSLYPQHAISNLVTALRCEKYATLANRSYFGTKI